MTYDLNDQIEAKVKQAEDNIKNSYKQYLEDIEDVKKLVPEEKRYLIEELIAETDRLHERILRYTGIHLRPFVTTHIRSLIALDKINASANDTTAINQHSA
ncbi:MAG: hypothetical protein EOM76_11125 [Sphingobacteriia bacterium]|nr:hypothetical protein [Sphingobacteriia bacterium]